VQLEPLEGKYHKKKYFFLMQVAHSRNGVKYEWRIFTMCNLQLMMLLISERGVVGGM
jgi:hypothetical protein